MQETRILMGMSITVAVANATSADVVHAVFAYFTSVDERFSTYKDTSEISMINTGTISPGSYSADMRKVLRLAEETKRDTDGYFSIMRPDGLLDPSGIVKGWAIQHAASIIESFGYSDYFIDAGGDVVVSGSPANGELWRIGLRDPRQPNDRVVKVLACTNCGIATSGSYSRGSHIYNPHAPAQSLADIVSITVIGPTVYDADRFATAAFAMQRSGIEFIESLDGFDGYMIDAAGTATMTSGLDHYICSTQ